MSKKNLQEHTYHVKGMHCAACEVILEKGLLTLPEVKSAEATKKNCTIFIKYVGKRPSLKELNEMFKGNNYTFHSNSKSKCTIENKGGSNWLNILLTVFAVILIFFLFQRLGLTELVNVTSTSSLFAFFLLGVIASLSTCIALVGGLVLSMSKQWNQLYSQSDSFLNKLQPHLMFNLGRIIFYGVFGTLLGLLGSQMQISLTFTSLLIISVSILMIFFALQMLGLKSLQKFQIGLPKFFTRYIADESNFKARHMPTLLGALTFFLPCGFTITALGLALLSSSAIQGGLIMFFFALGTAPTLLMLGISSVKFSEKPHLSANFLKVAGIILLFFAFYNLNSQFAVLGIPNLNTLSQNYFSSNIEKNGDLPPIVDGKQILEMDALAFGYRPNYFKVRVGVPVRWEISDRGSSGCTNAVISREFFDGEIPLTPGELSVKEFTPEKTGRYTFSCWMGMISGTIDVVDEEGEVNNFKDTVSTNETFFDIEPSAECHSK
jgi:uncharacterized protein